MITSTSNNKVKRLAALGRKARMRREEGVFLVEGEKMFLEAPAKWIREIYVSESFLMRCENSKDPALKNAFQNVARREVLADEVFRKISDTQTPQGILGVLSMPHYALDAHLRNWCSNRRVSGAGHAPLLLLLEDLQDPGNLGTIFRAGEGAGVNGIIMTSQCVDLFNPKTIRSTMGSIYRVPFFMSENLGGAIDLLEKNGVTVYAAGLESSMDYDRPDYTKPSAFLIGNESAGLKRETAQRAAQHIKIPMAGQVESLNAAVAASILMYEAARQQRSVGSASANDCKG